MPWKGPGDRQIPSGHIAVLLLQSLRGSDVWDEGVPWVMGWPSSSVGILLLKTTVWSDKPGAFLGGIVTAR